MRRATFLINDKPVSGHWHETELQEGEVLETRSGKNLVVVTRYTGTFNPGAGEMDGYFYSMREATEKEVESWNNRPDDGRSLDEILATIDYIGS